MPGVSTTKDPQSAIGMIERYEKAGYPFDIACMDYILTGLNGISLAKQLKQIDPRLLLKLLPSRLLGRPGIKEEYEAFGGFFEWPDVTTPGILRLIDQAKRNRKKN